MVINLRPHFHEPHLALPVVTMEVGPVNNIPLEIPVVEDAIHFKIHQWFHIFNNKQTQVELRSPQVKGLDNIKASENVRLKMEKDTDDYSL